MENLRITGLKLKNIGPFDDLEIEFPEKQKELNDKAEIHIFTGENGTGKTTLLHGMVATYEDPNHFSNRIRNNGDFEIIFSNQCILKYNEIHQNKGPRTKPILTSDQDKTIVDHYFNSFAYSGNRTAKKSSEETLYLEENFGVKAIVDSKTGKFTHVDFEKSILYREINKWIRENHFRKALASEQGNAIDIYYYREASQAALNFIKNVTGWEVEFDIDYKSKEFDIRLKYNEQLVPMDYLPEGVKSMLYWVTDLLWK